MNLFRMFAVCTLGLGLVIGSIQAADAVKSGPQVEEKAAYSAPMETTL